MLLAKTWLLLLSTAAMVGGFYVTRHGQLIEEAFDRVPAAKAYAWVGEAVGASTLIDSPATNGEASQHIHAMRPAGISTTDARAKNAEYISNELSQAVRAARSTPSDKLSAGIHLGLALHAVQDQKHDWCSCGPSSNPPDSQNACSSSRTGCPIGLGHHGLERCFYPVKGYNFQADTEGTNARQDQLSIALSRSVDLLQDFVAQVRRRQP